MKIAEVQAGPTALTGPPWTAPHGGELQPKLQLDSARQRRSRGGFLIHHPFGRDRSAVRALTEMHRVLRPGGTLGLWVAPSWWWRGDPRWNWHDDLRVSLDADVGHVPAGLDGPAPLQQMIRAAGFH